MLISIKNIFNRCRMAAVFVAICLVTFHASAQQNCTNCGVAYLKDRLFKPERNEYILPMHERDEKRLFYDSMMIMERFTLFIYEDAKGRETWHMDVTGYTFVDFRRKVFCNYRNFSDTARMKSATDAAEHTGWKDGGWAYFGKEGKKYEHSVLLPDTVLDGTRYGRLRGFLLNNGDTTIIETLYYVPEAERPMGFMGKVDVKSKKYSFVRWDHYDVASGIHGYRSIDINSHNLSKQELKVFAAWRKNAAKIELKKIKKGKILRTK